MAIDPQTGQYVPDFNFGLSPDAVNQNLGFQQPATTAPIAGANGTATPFGGFNLGGAGQQLAQPQNGLFGLSQNTWGNIGTGLQGAGALAQSWLGFQNLQLGRDQLSFQQDAFNRQFNEQKALTQRELADRDARRAAANT